MCWPCLFVLELVRKCLIVCLSINFSLVIAVCHCVSSSVANYECFLYKLYLMIAHKLKPSKESFIMTWQRSAEYVLCLPGRIHSST